MLQARGRVLAAIAAGAALFSLLAFLFAGEAPRAAPFPAATVADDASAPPPPSAEDFPGLDWGTQRPLRVLSEALGADADPRASGVRCLGTAPEDRTCRLHNACLDTSEGELVLFSGDNGPLTVVEFSLVDGSELRVPLAAGRHEGNPPLVYSGATRAASSGLTLTVRGGAVPPGQVAAWVDAPHVVYSRSDPADAELSVLDDYFSVWGLLTRWVGWPEQARGVGVLWWDAFRGSSTEAAESPGAARRFSQWFPGVAELDVGVARSSLAQSGRPLVCFRSLVIGTGGHSALRNAAAAFAPERTFPESPALTSRYASYRASHAHFAADALAALDLPSKADVQAGFERNKTLGDVLILVRGGGATRGLSNAAKLAEGLRTVCGGRDVKTLGVDALPPRELARALLFADAALAVHGVGAAAPLFMRPGTAFVDLLPPRAQAAQPALVGLALRLGVRVFTVPVQEQDCAPGASVLDQESYAADVEATRALVALAVGHEP